METEKVAANAAKTTARKVGNGFRSLMSGLGTALDSMAEAAERKGAARSEIEAQIEDYNTTWSPWSTRDQLTLITKGEYDRLRGFESEVKSTPTPRPPKRCGISTGFWDCEDRNCTIHREEKNERGIGTPTRNYR